jgi:hypothetical protein
MSYSKDVQTVRDLAKRYRDIAADPIQDERRNLWRKHNSLVRTRPLVLVMISGGCWQEIPASRLECEDTFLRGHENTLRRLIFNAGIGDDTVFEPWITQTASYVLPPNGRWGVEISHLPATEKRGSWKFDSPLKEPEDISKLIHPHHIIDETATAANVARLREAVGDVIAVNLDSGPYYRVWHADISYELAQLRGLEQIMWDMVERPEWLHALSGFLRDSVLAVHDEAEKAGDWRLCNHSNQAVPYAQELPDPRANGEAVKRNRLWCFMAAQEMAQVSPAMHEEFVLTYQLPILSRFGLAAYGCCEDLTHKIDMLRKIPNLRRIAVTPVADVARCAEQIRDDYVFSWRPNPAEMVCCGFDPGRVRKVVEGAMQRSIGCHVDITLKDVETVLGRPQDLAEWVRVVRSVTDRYA